jgi:predicted MFS family arabinose efflux permease
MAPRDALPAGKAPYLIILSLFLIFFIGGTLPSPIYLLLQQQMGFATSTLTGMFGCFYFGTILALLLFGHLTDRFGRRPVIAVSFALSLVGTILFLVSDSVALFYAARFFGGMASGLYSGAAVAAVSELHPTGDRMRAGVAAATATVLGIALGPTLAGLLINFAPHPTKLPFLLHALLVGVAVAGIWRLPETAAVRQGEGRLIDFRMPRVPGPLRGVFTAASLSAFAGWSGVGLFMALGPSLIEVVEPGSGRRLGGYAVAGVLLIAGLLQQSLRGRMAPRREALIGGLLLGAGLGATCFGVAYGSMPLLLCSFALVAAGHGFAWMSSSGRLSKAITSPEERGSILSAFYVMAYIGTGMPAFGLGFLADGIGMLPALTAYAILTAAIGLAAVLISE